VAIDTNGYSKKTFAFVAGALLATGATLLLTPQSGQELRVMLKRQAKKAQKTVLKNAKVLQPLIDVLGTLGVQPFPLVKKLWKLA